MNFLPVTNGAAQPVILLQQPSASLNLGTGNVPFVPQMSAPMIVSPGTTNSVSILPQQVVPQFAFAPTVSPVVPGIGGWDQAARAIPGLAGGFPTFGGGFPQLSNPLMNVGGLGGFGGIQPALGGLGFGGLGGLSGIGGFPGFGGIPGLGGTQNALSPQSLLGGGGSSSLMSLLLSMLLSNGDLGGLLSSLLGGLFNQGNRQGGFGGGAQALAQAGPRGTQAQATAGVPRGPVGQPMPTVPRSPMAPMSRTVPMTPGFPPNVGPARPPAFGPAPQPIVQRPNDTQVWGNDNVVQNPDTTIWGNNNRVNNNYFYFENERAARAFWEGADRFFGPGRPGMGRPFPFWNDGPIFAPHGANPGGPRIGGGATATVWGDPHFVGFEGDKYDVMGEPNKVYNILSDNDLQFNGRFSPWKGQNNATIISEAGILVGTDQIRYGLEGAPTLNGEAIVQGRTYNLERGDVSWDGTNLSVSNAEYNLKVIRNADGYLNYEAKIKENGVAADGVLPHGLLGQTADGNGQARMGKQGAGAQGEGAIEGNYKEYEVSNLFGTDNKYNRYGIGQNTAPQAGVNAAQGAQVTEPQQNNGQGGQGNANNQQGNGNANNQGNTNNQNNQNQNNGGQPPQQ